MQGYARDILTPEQGGSPRILAEADYTICCSPNREILEIAVSPDHANAAQLIGVRGGGASRVALAGIMGDVNGSPLYQILDDFAGASLVSGWVWSNWVEDWPALMKLRMAAPDNSPMRRNMTNICTGFAEGASSLDEEGTPDSISQSRTSVGKLENPDDLEGWHHLGEQQGTAMRRARRIDVWHDDGLIHVDAAFQDSGTHPKGGRTAIHEYQVTATVDPTHATVLSLVATPRILPYRECPGAVNNVHRLVGHPIANFRQDVLDVLPGALGCTHLNDVLRALADVPILARAS